MVNLSHLRRVRFPLASDVIQQRMKKLQGRQNQFTSPDAAELSAGRKETNYQVDREELINQNERNHRFRRQTFYSLVLRIWKDALDDLMEQRRRRGKLKEETGKINFQLSTNEKSQENKRGDKEPIQFDKSHETSAINPGNLHRLHIKSQHVHAGELNRPIEGSKFLQLPSVFVDANSLLRTPDVDTLTWSQIYKLPHIRAAFLVNRLKLYQTILVGAGTFLTAGYCIATSTWSLSHTLLFFGFGLTFGTLTALGAISSRLVAGVYIDSTGQLVRISHFNFWARRRDSIYLISDVFPVLPLTSEEWYCHLVAVPEVSAVTSGQSKYEEEVEDKGVRDFFISLKFGGVLDEEYFKRVFGKSALLEEEKNEKDGHADVAKDEGDKNKGKK